VLLRVYLSPSLPNVSIGSVSSNEDEALDSWRSIVRLWRAALHAESWASIIGALDLVDNQIVRREEPAPLWS